MAITPWSWNASNGQASAAQTRAAYNALITKSNTTNFSRYVWNDLVNKIYEVVRALSRNWNTQYASLGATRASYMFQSWTAAMFNSARLNTNYPSWWWSYDVPRTGYIGRTEVRGVSNYGDSGADIFYGTYILELADRLNTVIGIINGTQNVHELTEQIIAALTPAAELTSPEGLLLPRTRHKEILTPSALLQSENLPTMTLHFVIPPAEIRAVLEQEELSSMMEGYAFLTLNAGGRLNRLHSVLLSQMIPSKVQYAALLRLLEGAHFEATGRQQISQTGDLISDESVRLQGFAQEKLTVSGAAISKVSDPIGWTHYRVRLEPDAELNMEMNKIMVAVGAQRATYNVNLQRGTPTRMAADCDLSEELKSAAKIEEGTPHLLTLHHDVSTVKFGANLGTAHYMNGLDAALEMHPLAHTATLAYEHISTMLQAYFKAKQTSQAELSHYQTVSIAETVDIRVDITADAVSDYAPKLEKAVEILLDIDSELHSGISAPGTHHAQIVVVPDGTAVTGFAPFMGEIRQQMRLDYFEALIRQPSIKATSHNRIGVALKGNGIIAPAAYEPEAAFLFNEPVANGLLVIKEKLEMMASAGQSHSANAALEYLRGVVSAETAVEMQMQQDSELGYVYNAPLAVAMNMALLFEAQLDAEGGGWQYPVIIGTDAAIFQVWLTEQNRQHLFLDPHNGRYHAQITHAVSGEIDRQIRTDIAAAGSYLLAVNGLLNARQRGDWEYPVQTDNVLLITQAIDALPHYQYNLEVR